MDPPRPRNDTHGHRPTHVLEGYCPRCGDLIAAADQAPAAPHAPPTCARCGGPLGPPIVVIRRTEPDAIK
jgi:hypothetical protein